MATVTRKDKKVDLRGLTKEQDKKRLAEFVQLMKDIYTDKKKGIIYLQEVSTLDKGATTRIQGLLNCNVQSSRDSMRLVRVLPREMGITEAEFMTDMLIDSVSGK